MKVTRPLTDTVEDFEDFTGRTDAIYSVTVNARVTGYLDKVNFVDGKAFQDALNAESARLGKIIVENDIKLE